MISRNFILFLIAAITFFSNCSSEKQSNSASLEAEQYEAQLSDLEESYHLILQDKAVVDSIKVLKNQQDSFNSFYAHQLMNDSLASMESSKYFHIENDDINSFLIKNLLKNNSGLLIPLHLYDTVRVDDSLYYVVEGDLLMKKDELSNHYLSIPQHFTMASIESNKAIGFYKNGSYLRMNNPMSISYAIIESTFEPNEYLAVSKNFEAACRDWEGICKVKFAYQKHLDAELTEEDNPENLTFIIKKVNVYGSFIADSFFPDYEKYRRKVYVDQSYFSSDYDQVGIFRHEIGHMLGFRHEQINTKAPPSCRFSENYTNEDLISVYDTNSVMHYFCSSENFQLGSKKLEFSRKDSLGFQFLYPF